MRRLNCKLQFLFWNYLLLLLLGRRRSRDPQSATVPGRRKWGEKNKQRKRDHQRIRKESDEMNQPEKKQTKARHQKKNQRRPHHNGMPIVAGPADIFRCCCCFSVRREKNDSHTHTHTHAHTHTHKHEKREENMTRMERTMIPASFIWLVGTTLVVKYRHRSHQGDCFDVTSPRVRVEVDWKSKSTLFDYWRSFSWVFTFS